MKKQSIISACLLISGAIFPPISTAGVFHDKDINVRWEAWNETPGDGGALLAVIEEKDVIASDQKTPDIADFHSVTVPGLPPTTYELWDIDFNGESISFTYTSRYVGDSAHQYMLSAPEGFHIEDTEANLPDIIGVTVDNRFAPFGFEPSLVTFDANNIYVDLDGSMCHIDGMASMPDCANANSPTGFDNTIKLNVAFAGGGGNDNARIDAFLDWAEENYPDFFPNHVESIDIIGYRARHYQVTNIYLGAKDGRLFIYGSQFGGLEDLGELEQWFGHAGL